MNILNWQITTGCESLGGGCLSCPSLLESKEKGWNYAIKEHRSRFTEPLLTEEPSCFMVCLGSDLFHKDVTDQFIIDAFAVMNKCKEHYFEIATKRIYRAITMGAQLTWSDNIMVGTAVESKEYKYRIKVLKQLETKNKFISFAPLLGDVGELDLSGIKMAGGCGETWELQRPFDPVWLENIRKQCFEQDIQWISTHAIYEKEMA